jgi:hypothetical protein
LALRIETSGPLFEVVLNYGTRVVCFGGWLGFCGEGLWTAVEIGLRLDLHGSGWSQPSLGQLTINLELFRTRGIRLFN